MSNTSPIQNPAEQAAEKAIAGIYDCLEKGKSFRLEAGAGSGKTHSLVKALSYLVEKKGEVFARRNEKVACITFTNVASDEIGSRIDGHRAVYSSTIHTFCWSLLKDLQPFLATTLPTLPGWEERLLEGGGISDREITYELGFPNAKKEAKQITLHHDDVLLLMAKAMGQQKFRSLFRSRYPFLFIDEYQDTNRFFVESLKEHFVGKDGSPVLGFFGDHWQQIYGEDSCGKVEHSELEIIEQHANFRSVAQIVNLLNRMRPELAQAIRDPDSEGYVAAFHTNDWVGQRRTGKGGGHWTDDLPAEVAHQYLVETRELLEAEGWDFSPQKTKILMLTHSVLAGEQGYAGIAKIFSGRSDKFVKKEDGHIAFLIDIVEPVCIAYQNRRYGEMFAAMDNRTVTIHSHGKKMEWVRDMDALLALRDTGTIGQLIDHLRICMRPRLPEAVEKKETELLQWAGGTEEEEKRVERLRSLREVNYQEVVALSKFVDENTLYSTKHSVKGAEFENVLIVLGRGWNHYNFNQLLEWLHDPSTIPADRKTFERNRNLFYVACSRPKRRLALLFTQKLSDNALAQVNYLVETKNVRSLLLKAAPK